MEERIKELEDALFWAIEELIKCEKNITAVKLYRKLRRIPLKDAADWVNSRVVVKANLRTDHHNQRLENLELRVKLLESVQFPGPDNF